MQKVLLQKRKSGKFREEVFIAPVLSLQAPEWCHNWIFLLTCNSNKNFGQVFNKSTQNDIPMQWRQVKCPASKKKVRIPNEGALKIRTLRQTHSLSKEENTRSNSEWPIHVSHTDTVVRMSLNHFFLPSLWSAIIEFCSRVNGFLISLLKGSF